MSPFLSWGVTFLSSGVTVFTTFLRYYLDGGCDGEKLSSNPFV